MLGVTGFGAAIVDDTLCHHSTRLMSGPFAEFEVAPVADLADWALPYAERLYHRYPEVLTALGDPSLPACYDLGHGRGSRVRIHDSASSTLVKVFLQRRHMSQIGNAVARYSAGPSALPSEGQREEKSQQNLVAFAQQVEQMIAVSERAAMVLAPKRQSKSRQVADECNALQAQNAKVDAVPCNKGCPDSVDINAGEGKLRFLDEQPAEDSGDCSKRDAAAPLASGQVRKILFSELGEPTSPKRAHRIRRGRACPESPWQEEGENTIAGTTCHGRRVLSFGKPKTAQRTASLGRGRSASPTISIIAPSTLSSDTEGSMVSSIEQSSVPVLERRIDRSRGRQSQPLRLVSKASAASDGSAMASASTATPTAEGSSVCSQDGSLVAREGQSLPKAFIEQASDSDHQMGRSMSQFFSIATPLTSPQLSGNEEDAADNAGPVMGRSLTMPATALASLASPGGLRSRRGISLSLAESLSVLAQEPARERQTSPIAGIPLCAPKLLIKKQKLRRCPSSYRSGGSLASSPENRQPKVQLLSPKGSQRMGSFSDIHDAEDRHECFTPLPGAFPHRRTVIFFDWDDTLCPTSWIRRVLTAAVADIQEWVDDGEAPEDWRDCVPQWFHQPLPDDPAIRERIGELQQAVLHAIDVAQAYGVVCIVTNAFPGWVEKTIKKWLPELKPYIFGHGARPPIKVIYGQQAYRRPRGNDGLPWVDELGETMWWKRDAMSDALDELENLYRLDGGEKPPSAANSWCTDSQSRRICRLVSIGDDEAEMQAVELAARRWRPHGCSVAAGNARARGSSVDAGFAASRLSEQVRLVKFKDGSNIRSLCTQLEAIVELLPRLVCANARSPIRRDLGRIPLTPLLNKDSATQICSDCGADGVEITAGDVELGRSLRMQSV